MVANGGRIYAGSRTINLFSHVFTATHQKAGAVARRRAEDR
jgi:hypothetical protein